MRLVLSLLLLMCSLPSWSITREEMVIELKKFIQTVEEDSTFHDIITQSKFQFINEAYAANLDCFYGGWPSSLVKQGNRKYCSNPKAASPLYPKSSCKENEMSCQPLLFGEGLCVPSSTAQQRQSAFKYCENAFQKKGGSYDFVNNWGAEEKNNFQQMMDLAHKVCVSGEVGTQKKTGMCRNLWNKMSQFHLENVKNEKAVIVADAEVCIEETKPTTVAAKKNIEDVLNVTRKVASEEKMRSTDPYAVYRALKLDFETSPYCDPTHQYDEKGKKHMFFSGLANRLRVFQPQNVGNHVPELYDALMEELYTHFAMDDSNLSDINRKLSQLKSSVHNSQEFLTVSKELQASLLDIIYKKVQEKPILRDRYITLALQDAGVVELNDQDQVVCPFVDEETFVKAYTGYEKLEGKLKKPILTIVDYTKPSNQRRMFVMDMKKGEVLGNTWVSHGMGNGSEIQGKDGKGSSPEVSNTNNSQLSSAGFIMTAQASVGKEWGENIILKGLEAQNSNIQKRAIIIHGFRTQPLPNSMSEEDFDLFERWENASTIKEKADLIWEFKSIKVRPFIDATYGCLGVARHPTVDRASGKSVDMLDYLRKTINDGSLIYSHASSDQTSEYY
jgi:hypothetical protein